MVSTAPYYVVISNVRHVKYWRIIHHVNPCKNCMIWGHWAEAISLYKLLPMEYYIYFNKIWYPSQMHHAWTMPYRTPGGANPSLGSILSCFPKWQPPTFLHRAVKVHQYNEYRRYFVYCNFVNVLRQERSLYPHPRGFWDLNLAHKVRIFFYSLCWWTNNPNMKYDIITMPPFSEMIHRHCKSIFCAPGQQSL